MNREVKFRAWLPCIAKMTHTGTIEDIVKWAPLGCTPIWLQYTGLKDKNGLEIYEGDLYKRYNYLYAVEWDNDSFRFCGKVVARLSDFEPSTWEPFESDSSLYVTLSNERNITKVIGNIYEHPALLPTTHNSTQHH